MTTLPSPRPGQILRGCDVSAWQGAIDWPAVARSGLAFAYVRASHGVTPDAHGRANLTGARLAGLRVGGYHYLEAVADPAEQARAFADALGGDVAALPARLLPMLDVEAGPADTGARAVAFLRAFQALTGVEPGIYTMASFAARVSLGAHPELTGRPLWVAHWTAAAEPTMPAGWARWAIWQNTNRLRLPGVVGPIDGNVCTGALPEAGATGPEQVAAGVAWPSAPG